MNNVIGSRMRCPKCKIITDDSRLTRLSMPCPNCEAVCISGTDLSSREMWPMFGVVVLIEDLRQLSRLEPRFPHAELVLYCTVIEMLLDDCLIQCVESLSSKESIIASIVIEGARGVRRKIELINKLLGKNLKNVMSEIQCERWFESYYLGCDNGKRIPSLLSLRNDFVHGKTTLRYNEGLGARIDESLTDSLNVFLALNNWATTHIHSHSPDL